MTLSVLGAMSVRHELMLTVAPMVLHQSMQLRILSNPTAWAKSAQL